MPVIPAKALHQLAQAEHNIPTSEASEATATKPVAMQTSATPSAAIDMSPTSQVMAYTSRRMAALAKAATSKPAPGTAEGSAALANTAETLQTLTSSVWTTVDLTGAGNGFDYYDEDPSSN